MARETWRFLTNHTHVLACLRHDPNMAVREMAIHIGITERAVLHIIGDLEAAKVITRKRVGRRNQYELRLDAPLRHPLLGGARVADLVTLLDVGARRDQVAPS
ncbi:ArsR family transcriptional regulator [Intrasporangium chromatireducens Q5-1]|uniref:ArsR family transcriptional regulator n=1 Tax=Intrasporangium chromatireducens Q5-1 TaxID=584657 RepID=W9GRX8_9MICO|nr:winged helix-turn-helix transcriptional regulator [Intrasporangium chromatireducens]EWT06634.1 ArsR family transcriptional regulator [Intrasporangium chromatireducens Q5-1]